MPDLYRELKKMIPVYECSICGRDYMEGSKAADCEAWHKGLESACQRCGLTDLECDEHPDGGCCGDADGKDWKACAHGKDHENPYDDFAIKWYGHRCG